MVNYTVEAESLEEMGNELEEMGIIRTLDENWAEDMEVFQMLLDGVRTSHEKTDGKGNQQSKIAEYADLNDEFKSWEVGKLLDALVVLDRVEHDGRRYRLADDEDLVG